MSAKAVFTALFGSYESLNEEQAPADDVDFICFTDNRELQSERWRIVVVEPEFPLDPHRSQRRIKILGDPALERYDETLYIDNSISLIAHPASLFDLLLGEQDAGFVIHEGELTLEDAFGVVWNAGVDDPHRILEQWAHYRSCAPHVLNERVLWGGMIARRPTTSVAAAMDAWYHQVLRYSRRDQLSLPYVLATTSLPVAAVEIPQLASDWHRWRTDLGRKAHMRSVNGAVAPLGSLAERAREQELLSQLAVRTAERDEARAALVEQQPPRRRWRR